MSQNAVINTLLEKKYINYALALSRKNIGLGAENPIVGCVIVHNDIIISSGVTAKNGRPHAERIAIDKIKNKELLKKSTIYVTLEPCSHFGKTSPCVDEIIKYRFKKVVIATKDPDKRVNGSGIKKLQEAGIKVVCGVLENEARELNRGFFKAKTTNKPFITLKLATSLDGKIATKNFDSKWITCEKSRQFSHLLRSQNSAILIGANTARQDNPTLDCRLLGLEEFSPQKVIISQSLDLKPELNIFKNNPEKTLILTTNNQKFPTAKTLICAKKDGKIDLNDALEKLCQNGINSVLIEGGSQIATSFLQENLVDELVWIRSSKIIGNDGIAAIGEMNFEKISQVLDGFKRVKIREIEDDLVETYQKTNS